MVLAGKKPYFRAAIKKTSCPLCHTSNLSIINIPTPSSLSIINIPTPIRQIQSAPWRHPDVAAQPRRWHRHPSERASAHQPQSKSCKPTKTKYKKPCASPTTYTCDPTWKQNNIQYQVSSIPINTPTAKKQLPSIEGRSCPQGACCGSAQGNGANTCWFCWCYTYMHVYIHIYNILYVYILEDPLHLSYIYIYIFHYMTNNVALQVRHSARLQQTLQTHPERHPASFSLIIGILSSELLSHVLTTSSKRMWLGLFRELDMMAEPNPFGHWWLASGMQSSAVPVVPSPSHPMIILIYIYIYIHITLY